MIQARQLERILDLHLGQGRFVGEVVDADDHLARRIFERSGQGVERLLRQAGEVVERGGDRVGHVRDIAAPTLCRNGAR